MPPTRPGLTAGPRLLVVDDEASARRVCAELLRRHRYSVDIAEHGEVALSILRATADEPWVVVCDWRMPVVGGAEFLRRVRTLERPPAVIVTSGYDTAREDALAAGACAFLQKPFPLSQLLEAVRQAAETVDA
ncbi:MAG: response regulator [Vicinamibacterales bacterium]